MGWVKKADATVYRCHQLRPAPAEEQRAKPRKGAAGKDGEGWAPILRQENEEELDDEDERRQLEQETQHGYGIDEQKPLQGMTVCTTGKLDLSKVRYTYVILRWAT